MWEDTDSPRLSRLKCAKGRLMCRGPGAGQRDNGGQGESEVVLRHPRGHPVPWSRERMHMRFNAHLRVSSGYSGWTLALRLPAVGGPEGSDLDSVKLSWKKKVLSIPSLAACWAHAGTLSQRKSVYSLRHPGKG